MGCNPAFNEAIHSCDETVLGNEKFNFERVRWFINKLLFAFVVVWHTKM